MSSQNRTNEKLFLEVEKIPPGSEALRIVNADKEVRFVCIASPTRAEEQGKFFWLGCGVLKQSMRELFRKYLKTSRATNVQFFRVKEGGGKKISQTHKLKQK